MNSSAFLSASSLTAGATLADSVAMETPLTAFPVPGILFAVGRGTKQTPRFRIAETGRHVCFRVARSVRQLHALFGEILDRAGVERYRAVRLLLILEHHLGRGFVHRFPLR